MPKFEYSAQNKAGKTLKGTIEASTRDAGAELLVKRGYKPIMVRPVKTGFDPNHIKLPGSKKVKSKDLVIFTRQLSTMVSAGVPLTRSLATMTNQIKSDYFREVLTLVSKDVESGVALAEALEKHPKAFSSIYVNMVKAGEAGGILDEILKRLASQQEKDQAIRTKIKSAMTYPVILTVIMAVAFMALMLFVVPKIGGIIKDVGGEDAELPIYTQAMLEFSDFIVQFWYIFIGLNVGGAIAFKKAISTPKGKYIWHTILLKIPIIKIVIIKVSIARFARIFASLMSSGVAVLDALSVTGAAMGNLVIEEELKKAAQEVKNGKQLSEPLSQSPVFPDIVSQMLAVGEETGQIDTILLKVADFYEEEVDAVVEGMSSIIEPIMIVVLGAMVGLIAASVMGPISSLSQSI